MIVDNKYGTKLDRLPKQQGCVSSWNDTHLSSKVGQ